MHTTIGCSEFYYPKNVIIVMVISFTALLLFRLFNIHSQWNNMDMEHARSYCLSLLTDRFYFVYLNIWLHIPLNWFQCISYVWKTQRIFKTIDKEKLFTFCKIMAVPLHQYRPGIWTFVKQQDRRTERRWTLWRHLQDIQYMKIKQVKKWECSIYTV